MYFEDLSAYAFAVPQSLPDVQNVGWLSASHSFTQCDSSAALKEMLRRCALECAVNRTRGFHTCELCADPGTMLSITVDQRVLYLDSAEIWLPAPHGKVFAAPNLIVHYVEAHGYCPPAEFVSSVMNVSARANWNA